MFIVSVFFWAHYFDYRAWYLLLCAYYFMILALVLKNDPVVLTHDVERPRKAPPSPAKIRF
jgi:hypothetical protein